MFVLCIFVYCYFDEIWHMCTLYDIDSRAVARILRRGRRICDRRRCRRHLQLGGSGGILPQEIFGIFLPNGAF